MTDVVYLIVAGILFFISGYIVRSWVERKGTPDGILCVTEEDEKFRANFIFCIPTGELLHRKCLYIEVKNMSPDPPDESQ